MNFNRLLLITTLIFLSSTVFGTDTVFLRTITNNSSGPVIVQNNNKQVFNSAVIMPGETKDMVSAMQVPNVDSGSDSDPAILIKTFSCSGNGIIAKDYFLRVQRVHDTVLFRDQPTTGQNYQVSDGWGAKNAYINVGTDGTIAPRGPAGS